MTNLKDTVLAVFAHVANKVNVDGEYFIKATDVLVKLFNDVEYAVYSRVTKVNGKGRWFHWELNVPTNLEGMKEVFGSGQVFAWAVRGLLTDHTNMVAQIDLAKPHTELKKAFLNLNHTNYVKKLYNAKKLKADPIESMSAIQLEYLISQAQAKLAEKQAKK